MDVEGTDQGCSLTGIVIQSQQLETSIVTGTQVALYLIFISQHLQSTAGHEEAFCLISHAIVT